MLYPELQSLDDFEFIKNLGSGYSSSVDLYRHIQTDRIVAIKKLSIKNLTQSECRKTYDTEITILTKLQGCSNVVQLIGYGFYTTIENSIRRTRTINNYFLILEYIDVQPLDKNSERITKQFYYKLLQTLQKIHELGIVHRDLNLNNVLVQNNEPILIDFAFGLVTNGKQKVAEFYGTKPYVAPEIIDGQSYLPYPTEVYSLGVILLELINNNESKEIALQMMQQNPYKRPNLEDVIAHPWFQL
ncbi:unnamed protein product [Paramecium pentaurelia]|uniref:Protein kinase domain-containing protein n=1 Tax=Paramecium pentaurelia TaxID=43138 RepID=A0A8S1U899_9CILI|nr:unnamed protein product [Paramecium pentaurelia]